MYDSSVILEYLFNGRNRPYFRAGRGATTWLNLMEVYYILLRDGQTEPQAAEAVSAFQSNLVDFSFEDVRGAMALRLRWRARGKRISYVDAVAYFLSRKTHRLFLTGDAEFRRAEGVTFLRTGPAS